MHQITNRIQVIVERRHIRKILAVIAVSGKTGTNGTIKGSFVLN